MPWADPSGREKRFGRVHPCCGKRFDSPAAAAKPGVIALAHAGIGKRQHRALARLRRQGFERADGHERQRPRHGEPLRHGAGKPQPGEGPGPGAKRDGGELPHGKPRFFEHGLDRGQHVFGVAGVALQPAFPDGVAALQRHGGDFAGSFDREQIHAGILPPGWAFSRAICDNPTKRR